MTLAAFAKDCFETIGEQKGYRRYKKSWYRVENEILLGFGLESQRYHGFTIAFDIMPLVCGIEIYGTGQMRFAPKGAYFRHTRDQWGLNTLELKDAAYCSKTKAYLHHVFFEAVEPFLDGVHDLESAFDVIRQYERYDAEYALGVHNLTRSFEIADWLHLCALKRYEACLENANKCLTEIGHTEFDPNGQYSNLYSLLRSHNYAAIEAILEENRQRSIKELKEKKII